MSGVSIGEIAVAGDRVVFLRHPGTEDTSIEVVRSARP
jgi:hypothetical protein